MSEQQPVGPTEQEFQELLMKYYRENSYLGSDSKIVGFEDGGKTLIVRRTEQITLKVESIHRLRATSYNQSNMERISGYYATEIYPQNYALDFHTYGAEIKLQGIDITSMLHAFAGMLSAYTKPEAMES